MLLGAGAGIAAAAPATTGSATSVSSTSAQLNGTIEPGGIPTFWAFEYGTSSTYGQNTPAMGPLTDT
ncbi:MAG TPA: hypothetical protein VIJ20_02590, partial [Solirubrobacteraceae bacterium]